MAARYGREYPSAGTVDPIARAIRTPASATAYIGAQSSADPSVPKLGRSPVGVAGSMKVSRNPTPRAMPWS